jgi:hypothetical protein
VIHPAVALRELNRELRTGRVSEAWKFRDVAALWRACTEAAVMRWLLLDTRHPLVAGSPLFPAWMWCGAPRCNATLCPDCADAIRRVVPTISLRELERGAQRPS